MVSEFGDQNDQFFVGTTSGESPKYRSNISAIAFTAIMLTSTQLVQARERESFSNLTSNISSEVSAVHPLHVLDVMRKDLKAIETIRELALLKDGWKGEGSIAAPRKVTDDAEQFARFHLKDQDIEPPFIGLDADGDITFFWKTEKVIMDLSIYGDGTFSYFAEGNNKQTFGDEDIPIETHLPEDLLKLLDTK